MEKHNCETCKFRKKYDAEPGSLLGRLWRWHAGWCPGWKKYMTSLDREERIILAKRYRMKKFQ